MNRGLRAQLSPREEAALRRISQSDLPQISLRGLETEKLLALRLIEMRDGAWALTATGQRRTAGRALA